MNKRKSAEVDSSILIAGLGISGLITACVFAKYDFSISCFDPLSKRDKHLFISFFFLSQQSVSDTFLDMTNTLQFSYSLLSINSYTMNFALPQSP